MSFAAQEVVSMQNVTRDGAADLLCGLAERTVHAPEPRGTGRYHYVHTSGEYLYTASDTDGRVLSAGIECVERRQWIAPDGSGRLLVTRGGESVQPTGDYPPGGLAALFITSTAPVAVTAELRKWNPQGTATRAMKTFTQIWNNQVVPSMLHRLLLLDLAEYPDLFAESATQDRTGRPGVAVGHLDQGRNTRHLLVFDEKTGALIGAEVMVLDGAGVPIPTPATTSSTAWLFAGYCATTAEPPH